MIKLIIMNFVYVMCLIYIYVILNNFFFSHLDEALKDYTPNLIIYNAGTDILINDPLGGLDITPQVYNDN